MKQVKKIYESQLQHKISNVSEHIPSFQGGTASCPEILGEGKPASESPTFDFGALALEIVSSLEGKESDGVAPVISTDTKKNPDIGSDFKGPTECRWDDECASEQNQVITFYKKNTIKAGGSTATKMWTG